MVTIHDMGVVVRNLTAASPDCTLSSLSAKGNCEHGM
ncbi:predicted protein [Sclerotinia sclerotiorum 1980 UF-70]|uniref:Uncharacterized protein n=1 Tax=Sclerotinia sclerotiorum (strain ATCC 18683 / 1980 / Ss-1) TaxID=665079 RepID=A7F119_SCLS1|nr:predicted protein [Sclerotinia sclerotiorum 1980 UF-70]EDN95411.1 predicted protein [Sclerotinia sclerotiorum 1980 UF-70]